MAKSTVCFQSNQTTASWSGDHRNLLEFAESLSLKPSFGCRLGHCGGCKVNVEAGCVKPLFRSQIDLDEGEALLCCSIPSSDILILSRAK